MVKIALFGPDDPATSYAYQKLKPQVLYGSVYADPATAVFENTTMYNKKYPYADEIYGSLTRPQWMPNPVGTAGFYAETSLSYPKIKGVFLDDLVDQLAKGDWTVEAVHSMIGAVRSVNPALKIQATYYPSWNEDPAIIKQFDIDEIWFAANGPDVAANLPSHLNYAYGAFLGKKLWGGLNPRSEFAGHMTDEQWAYCLEYYRREWEARRIDAVSIYNADYLDAEPYLADVAFEILTVPTPTAPFNLAQAIAAGTIALATTGRFDYAALAATVGGLLKPRES